MSRPGIHTPLYGLDLSVQPRELPGSAVVLCSLHQLTFVRIKIVITYLYSTDSLQQEFSEVSFVMFLHVTETSFTAKISKAKRSGISVVGSELINTGSSS